MQFDFTGLARLVIATHLQLFLTILFTSLQEPGLFPPLSDSRVLHELCRDKCCSLVRVVGLGGSDPEKRCRSFSRPEDRLHRGFHKFLQIFLLKKKRKSKMQKTSEILLLCLKALLFQWLVPLVLFSGLNVCAYLDPILPSPISNMNKMGYYSIGNSP